MIDSAGAFTGVLTVLLGQLVEHDESPPPPTLAVFAIVVPAAAGNGVTGTVKLTGEFVAKPAAMVHVSTWPAMEQPAGAVPSVSVEANVSLTVAAAVVAAVPVFVTVSV